MYGEEAGSKCLAALCDQDVPGNKSKSGGRTIKGKSNSVKGEEILPGEVTCELGFED